MKAKAALKLTFLHMLWLLLIQSMLFGVSIAACACDSDSLTDPIAPDQTLTVPIGGGTVSWPIEEWGKSNGCIGTDDNYSIGYDGSLPDWIILDGSIVKVTTTDTSLDGTS